MRFGLLSIYLCTSLAWWLPSLVLFSACARTRSHACRTVRAARGQTSKHQEHAIECTEARGCFLPIYLLWQHALYCVHAGRQLFVRSADRVSSASSATGASGGRAAAGTTVLCQLSFLQAASIHPRPIPCYCQLPPLACRSPSPAARPLSPPARRCRQLRRSACRPRSLVRTHSIKHTSSSEVHRSVSSYSRPSVAQRGRNNWFRVLAWRYELLSGASGATSEVERYTSSRADRHSRSTKNCSLAPP